MSALGISEYLALVCDIRERYPERPTAREWDAMLAEVSKLGPSPAGAVDGLLGERQRQQQEDELGVRFD